MSYLTHNKLFSVDEFKKRLSEAKTFKQKDNFSKTTYITPGNEKKVKIKTFTINDNRNLLFRALKNKKVVDSVYDNTDHGAFEGELTKYMKKKAFEGLTKKMPETKNTTYKRYHHCSGYLQKYITKNSINKTKN